MASFEPGTTSVQIGVPRADHAQTLRQQSQLHAAKAFACEDSRCMDEPFYATSWALFSFLLNERYDQLGRYLGLLNDPSEERRAKAWGEAFGDLPPDKPDDALRGWLRAGNIALPRINVTVHETPTRERPLGDADVLAARALLDFKFKDEVTAMRTLSEALRIDRTKLLALLIDVARTHSIEADDARATAAAHPDDWRAWRMLAFALKGSPEGYRAMGRACELAGSEAPECDRLHE